MEVDYDHFSPAVLQQPEPIWAEFLELSGLHSHHHGGFHLACRYADILEVVHDTETFTSTKGVQLPKMPFPALIPIEVDPPAHRSYRRILNPPLSPSSVAPMEPAIREMAVGLISDFDGEAEVDFCSAYAIPLPKRLAIRLIGFPEEDLDKLDNWVERMTSGARDENLLEFGPAFFGYVQQFLATRRNAPPANDLTSVLIDASFEGQRPLEDGEVLMTLLLLLFGGLHTTTSAIAGMVMWLADHPDGRERLRREPELHASAVEEFLRWVTPVPQLVRYATRNAEVAGCPIREGEPVMVVFGAGNRDPSQFTDPDEVVLDRFPNRHLSFGMGPHRCVGSHLAKAMLRVTLEEVLGRMGDFRVADRDQLEWSGGEARGLRRLPLVLEGR
jgi:cytochrome P450